ncbi:MAG TPA: hypothetical protein VEA41_10500 [Salinarimonas sp.]|nr:hypothetical protein [Salinarimonas sp.]
MSFYICHCITGEERKAAERLLGQFPTWHHPLLAGYLFVEASAPPWPARYTEGVIRLLPQSDAPQPVSNDVMAVLQETCRAYEEAMRPITKAQKFAENAPLAGATRKMVAHLLASAGFSVTLGAARVELTTSSPGTGRQHSAHQKRRAARAVAGA